MQESIVFLLGVQCRRKESSRSLSDLLMSFMSLPCEMASVLKTTIFVRLNFILFSVVAFKKLDLSQDSVAKHMRYCGIFSDSIITIFSRF